MALASTITQRQIDALDEAVMAYVNGYLSERLNDEDMSEIWVNAGQGVMMVMGLRRAQLLCRQKTEGLALIA
jgi:hypothetical protein